MRVFKEKMLALKNANLEKVRRKIEGDLIVSQLVDMFVDHSFIRADQEEKAIEVQMISN